MIKTFIIISFLSVLFSREKIFWDLGVVIKDSKKQQTQNIINPLISNTQISPVYKNPKDSNLFDLTTSNLSLSHIIKLLYTST